MLAFDLDNGINATKTIQLQGCPKVISMQVWKESSQRFKKRILLSENFTYLSPRVTLEIRSRSKKSNHFLRLSRWYMYASLAKNIHLFKRYPIYKTMTLERGQCHQNLKPTTMIYKCKSGVYPSIGCIIFSKNFTYLCLSVTLKLESRSPTSNQQPLNLPQ